MSSSESSPLAASRTTQAISSASKGGVKHPKTSARRAAMISPGVLRGASAMHLRLGRISLIS